MRPKPYERFAVFTVDSVNRHTCDHALETFKENDIPYTLYVATGLIEGNGTFVDEAVEELIRRQDRILLQTKAGTFTLDCTSVAGKYRSYAILMNHLRNEIEDEAVADRVREICWLYRIDADEIRSESVISWDDVARYDAAQHCSVASGTIGGARLSKLTDDKVKYEITQSCLVLEGVTGIKCRDIAYPTGCKGGVGSREFDIARKARLQTAVTNRPGLIYPEHRKHLHALPRIPLGAAYQRRRYFGPLTTGLPTRLSNYGRRLVFP